jgi:hypothetical protein
MNNARDVIYAGVGGLSLVVAPELLPFILIGVGLIFLWLNI